MKLAKVIPNFKAGIVTDVNNYRPISLLPIFSKILEKIMHNRLSTFIEIQGILYESQFGFQKNKSAGHSLVEIIEKIRYCLDHKRYGCGIFIDLKKAFDTVNHAILLRKLEHYGIRNAGLSWFESYLTDRCQFVFCNDAKSDIKSISCGVPQGSVLGPLLFLLYINDLPNISTKLKFFLFADDTNIFFDHNNLNMLEKIVNQELKKLSLWLNANRLALNVSKTNFVVFAPKNKASKNVTIIINRHAIEEKEYVKYLGVLIDSQLSFNYHIKAVNKKISRTVGLMSKLRYLMNQKTLIMLYYALIYPFLSYGVTVWGNGSKTCIESLLKTQNRAVRIISNNDRMDEQFIKPSANPLLHQHNQCLREENKTF